MTPLDSRNLQRLDSTLADIERAIDVSRVHVVSGCPDAGLHAHTLETSSRASAPIAVV